MFIKLNIDIKGREGFVFIVIIDNCYKNIGKVIFNDFKYICSF